MADYNKEAYDIWSALKPIIDAEIEQRMSGMVQRRKAKVTTAPSLATNTIGVTEAFGPEIFIPFVSNIISAQVGDLVWVEWMYGATNAFVSSFANVGRKDKSVSGNLTMNGSLVLPQRMSRASLSSPGWYRVLKYNAPVLVAAKGSSGHQIDIHIGRNNLSTGNETHFIRCASIYNNIVFLDEQSASIAFGIDKIRYGYNQNTNQAYIDIHYNLSAQNTVWAYFDVYDGLASAFSLYTSAGLAAVADAPSGETIMTTYTFSANGTGDLNVNGTVSGQGFSDLLLGIGNEIAANSDCDSLTVPGKYTCRTTAISQTVAHAPFTDAFALFAITVAQAGRLVHVAIANNDSCIIKLRRYDGTNWTAWKTLTPT